MKILDGEEAGVDGTVTKNRGRGDARGQDARRRRGAAAVLLILLGDELQGFTRSRVIYFLWIGLPALSLVMTWLTGDLEQFPSVYMTAMLTSTLAGGLGAVMLGSSITSESNRNVHDLFLVRPVRRWQLLVSKYLAAYCCILVAAWASILLSMLVNTLAPGGELVPPDFFREQFELSLVSIFFASAVSCSFGLLFGVVMKSVAGSAILSFYVGNQAGGILTAVPLLVNTFTPLELDLVPFSALTALGITVVVLALSILIFERKER